jgi:hypothetical protein
VLSATHGCSDEGGIPKHVVDTRRWVNDVV